MRGYHFLVHGHKKDLPYITCIFHLLKYVVNFLMSAILHHISLLRLLPKSYFKISTFQHNCLCSSSFKIPLSRDFMSLQLNDAYMFVLWTRSLALQIHVLSLSLSLSVSTDFLIQYAWILLC